MPDKDIGLQDTGVDVGDSYQHIPQGGISDFRNLLLGEQPKMGQGRRCWDGKGMQASSNPRPKDPDEKRDPEGSGRVVKMGRESRALGSV